MAGAVWDQGCVCCSRLGFLITTAADILVICPAIHRPAISHHIHSHPYSAVRIDIQSYEETAETGVGTCTLLRHFSSRIARDFVLLPCDFIPPPSFPLSTLLNKFRTDTVSDGLIATTCWFTPPKSDKNATPDEWGHTPSPVSIVWDKSSGTLLYVDTSDEQDRNSDEVELHMSMLSRYALNFATCFVVDDSAQISKDVADIQFAGLACLCLQTPCARITPA